MTKSGSEDAYYVAQRQSGECHAGVAVYQKYEQCKYTRSYVHSIYPLKIADCNIPLRGTDPACATRIQKLGQVATLERHKPISNS